MPLSDDTFFLVDSGFAVNSIFKNKPICTFMQGVVVVYFVFFIIFIVLNNKVSVFCPEILRFCS